ncbi:hypothetical protein BD769DRAFT_1662376 [Suillus cothurnatus]|nr:hypothetical protein BD769DRAFT_1662376 [Suillus cothurnatus]
MSPIIMMSDWSKLPGVFSQASYVLTEANQQANQAASQNDMNLKNIDWSKVWAYILSALGQAGRLLYDIRCSNLTSLLMGALGAYFLGPNCGALFSPVFCSL